MSKTAGAPAPWKAWTVAVLVIIGFTVGGCGVIFGWPMFWTGVAIIVAGFLLGWRVRIMAFTEEYLVAGERAEPETRALHG
ncbi:MAG TPA: hypothetical protein VNG13_03385 [Mycobacteriales bacterium]|nr:hypothetical protein [Mycobacteriales bacterium]